MKKLFVVFTALLFVLAGCDKTKKEQDDIMQGFEKTPSKGNALLENSAGTETFSEEEGFAPRTLCEEYLKRGWEIKGAKEDISDAANSETPVHMFIRFEDEGVYHMGYLDRPYEDIVGFYEMGGNTVKLRPPAIKNFSLYEVMFPGNAEQIFIYEYDYPDFYDFGVLYNDNIVLRSHFHARPEETSKKLILDGIEVYKEKERYYTVTENLRLRSRPSVSQGKLKTIDSAYSLYRALKYMYGDFESEEDFSDYAVNSENTKSEVLLKGQEVRIVARTANEDTIDGVTAPWYYILIPETMNLPYQLWKGFWIFGGYNNSDYSYPYLKTCLLSEAKARGMIIPGREKTFSAKANNEEAHMELGVLESAFEKQWSEYSYEVKKSPDMKYGKSLYFKNGNYYYSGSCRHVTNEYLDKTSIKIKIGMTKNQVKSAWGEPHAVYGNCWTYVMSFDGHGFEFNLTWDNNSLKVIQYEHWK